MKGVQPSTLKSTAEVKHLHLSPSLPLQLPWAGALRVGAMERGGGRRVESWGGGIRCWDSDWGTWVLSGASPVSGTLEYKQVALPLRPSLASSLDDHTVPQARPGSLKRLV